MTETQRLDYPASSRRLQNNVKHLVEERGEFYGSRLNWLSLETQLIENWRPRHLKVELERMSSAWFDYRMLHPAQRAHVCYFEYKNAFHRKLKKYYMREDWTHSSSLFNRKPQTISQFLTVMHVADELGMPYERYFDEVMEHMLMHSGYSGTWELNDALKTRPIPPISLLARGDSVMFATQAFDTANSLRITLPKHEMFQGANWTGSKIQRDFAEWVMNQARRKGSKAHFILKQIMDKGYLTEREILRKFGTEMVLSIRAIDY